MDTVLDLPEISLNMRPCDAEALTMLVKKLNYPTVVEIGSFVGASALVMAAAGAQRVYCIDTWDGRGDPNDIATRIYAEHGWQAVVEQFAKNTRGKMLWKIVPMRGDSQFYAKFSFPVDMVYVDGCHSYRAVAADIDAWWPHVKPGGIIAGHDYDPYWPGVVKAVDAFGGCQKVNDESTVWWRQKDA